jgi:hypothetical protein
MHTMATTADLSPGDNEKFTNAPSLARSHQAIARVR